MNKKLNYGQRFAKKIGRLFLNIQPANADTKTLEDIRALCSKAQYGDALQSAATARGKYPNDLNIGQCHANLIERINGYSAALLFWADLRRQHPQNTFIQYRYLIALIKVDGKSSVQGAIKKSLKQLSSNTDRHELRTMLEPEIGNTNSGIRALEVLVKTDVNSNALHALLLHHIFNKNFDFARAALDSKFISNETYLDLFSLSEEINRHKPAFAQLGEDGEAAKKLALSFFKKRIKKPFKVRPRNGFNIFVLDKITDNSLDAFAQELVIKCSEHTIDREHFIKEMALIIGDEAKCSKPHLDALKAVRLKITNLALYPSTRAPGTFDPSTWIDDALKGFPKPFIRDTKAITLRFLDTPPEAIYVWGQELLAQTILAAKSAHLHKPVVVCFGDALRPADKYTLGVLAAAIETDCVVILYDHDLTHRRITAFSDLGDNVLVGINSYKFQELLKGSRNNLRHLLIVLDNLYNQS